MQINEEISLLIKSKYPVVYIETIDETHSLKQLRLIASQLNLTCFYWSVSEGLRKAFMEGEYYNTKEPAKMLQMLLMLVKPRFDTAPVSGIFILKDLQKFLDDPVTLRHFKDVVNTIKNCKNTIIILSSEYKLPVDIQGDSAHIIGGYPSSEEIEFILKGMDDEFQRLNPKIPITIKEEELSVVAQSLKGLSIQQIKSVVNRCLFEDRQLSVANLPTIEKYKQKLFDQEGLLEYYLTESKDNIAGFNNLKKWLSDRKICFVSNRNSSLPAPKGVLLIGVQGCGKSLAVKAIAKEFKLSLYRLDLGRLYSKYIGETEQNLRKALSVVDNLSPMCLWLDEIEKGFASSSGEMDGGVSQRILGTFLTWMQERKSLCFVAATANDVYQLPPEFLRKGRFDELFFVDLPDDLSREQLFKIHINKRGFDHNKFDLKSLSKAANGFSGAEIEQAVISALYLVASNKQVISTEHIITEIKSTKPLSVLKEEEVTRLREWAKDRTISA